MSASGAAEVSAFKVLQWGLEEHFNVGDPVVILLSLPEPPSPEALSRFHEHFRAWLATGDTGTAVLKVTWRAPVLQVALKRPPRSADLATVLEKAVEELGMSRLKVGYR